MPPLVDVDPVSAILTVTSDRNILDEIKAKYTEDEFCKWLSSTSMAGWHVYNGLCYIGDRLLIPHVGNLRENLFQLAHDCLGHFGADKLYASLRDTYYWLNMCRNLEQVYIPSCIDCLQNKSHTTQLPGPLHPLPVPDECGVSVAMDFIGPLPTDKNYDCILTITDRLNSDIRIIPTKTTITAEQLAEIFFDNWYCENGLPSDIICNQDKLFISQFWKVLTKLTGVKLKMLSAYQPMGPVNG